MSDNDRIVDSFLVVDAHSDSLIRRRNDESPVDLAGANPLYDVDLPRLRAGGVNCLFCMVGDSELEASLALIDAAYQMCDAHSEDFALCRSRAEIRSAYAENKIAIVLTIEGQSMFGENIGHLRTWHRLGVRVASITHGGARRPELQHTESFFGYLEPDERVTLRRHSRGLTGFARESLGEMARLRIPVDLAHINDTAFWEVLEEAEGPVCYTHGACYSLCPHSRALTDEMMKALAARGGVMGIAFYRGFIDRETPSIERLGDHFMHALEVMGSEHVGIGTDFDGLPRWSAPIPHDVAALDQVFQVLARRGVEEVTLRRIAGENFLNLLVP